MANVKLDFADLSGTGGGGSTATAYFLNNSDVAVPHAWVPDTDPEGGSVSNNRISDMFTLLTFSNFKDSSGNPIKGFQNFAADTWRDTVSANMYDGSTQLNCIKRGCMPLFRSDGYFTNGKLVKIAFSKSNTGTLNPHYYTTSTSNVKLTRTTSSLTIGSSSYKSSDFKDGVIPKWVYFLAIGAGGGGGGTTASSDASGGGAGGWCGGLINLEGYSTLILKCGAGGKGGYKSETNSAYAGAGTAGGATVVGLENGTTYFLMANGGMYGRNGTSVAGSGGSYSNSCGYCKSGGSGGSGSKGDTTSGGGSADTGNLRVTEGSTTLRSSADHHIYVTISVPLGGSNGDTDESGGCGSSLMGTGGAGGYTSTTQSNNYGKAGGTGAGGGGARYYLGRYNKGGNGGDGAILLWW